MSLKHILFPSTTNPSPVSSGGIPKLMLNFYHTLPPLFKSFKLIYFLLGADKSKNKRIYPHFLSIQKPQAGRKHWKILISPSREKCNNNSNSLQYFPLLSRSSTQNQTKKLTRLKESLGWEGKTKLLVLAFWKISGCIFPGKVGTWEFSN